MLRVTKFILFIITTHLMILASCQQVHTNSDPDTRIPYLFIENASQSGHSTPRSIYKISADGSQVEHIYDFGERVLYWFSPDFRYIVFTGHILNSDESKPDLMVLDLSVNQIVAQIPDVTLYRGDVIWNSSSNKFLFNKTQSVDDSTDWWIYDITYNSQERLTTEISIKWFPSWSRDDRYIAYVATPCLDHGDICETTSKVWNITIIDLKSKTVSKVTDFENSPIKLLYESGDVIFCNLKWSFDNRYIAFENQCGKEIGGGTIYERHRVFTVNVVDMAVQEALKFEHTQEYAYSYNYEWVEIGHLLIGYSQINFYDYQTFLRGGILNFDPLQSLAIRSPELLGFLGSEVSWSPDGRTFIAFTEEPIFEINPNDGQLNGSGATLLGEFENGNLTVFPMSIELPYSICFNKTGHWSIDGQYVAYTSIGQQHICNQDLTNADVYVYSLETEELNNITQNLDGISRPLGWLISDTQ